MRAEGGYPSLSIRFTIGGATREAVALIDTGFDGNLVVPESLVSQLSATAFRHRVKTASGEVVRSPVFRTTIEFVDIPGTFPGLAIALGDEFLVGLLSINRIQVTLDHGQRVLLEP